MVTSAASGGNLSARAAGAQAVTWGGRPKTPRCLVHLAVSGVARHGAGGYRIRMKASYGDADGQHRGENLWRHQPVTGEGPGW